MGFRGGGVSPVDPVLEEDRLVGKYPGFVVDIITTKAIAWLHRRDRTRPFALSIHLREPHGPHLPVPDEDWERISNLEISLPEPLFPGLDIGRVKKTAREYLAAVAAVDRSLGRVLTALDELQVSEETLVVFTSDHGYNMGHHGLIGKGNGNWALVASALPEGTANIPQRSRPNMFDTSLRVPLVMRWPGVISPGMVIERTVSHLDWLPTFAAIGGATVSDKTVVRGRNLVPLLRERVSEWNDDFYGEYSMKHGVKTDMRTYRTPYWKLTRDFNNEGRDELYHLGIDPGETRNLIEDPRLEVRAMLGWLNERIIEKLKSLNDPILVKANRRIER
jgi:uncharacterized sulfatase